VGSVVTSQLLEFILIWWSELPKYQNYESKWLLANLSIYIF